MARDPSERERRRLLRLLELQERERILLAYDIHDGFVQEVLGAQLGIDAMLDRLSSTDPESIPRLLRVRSLIRKAIAEARRVVSELRPATGDDRGLVESIQALVGEAESAHRLDVKFNFPGDFPQLPPLLVGTLTRIVQESLNNVRRHAQTREAELRLSGRGNRVRLEIEDHGIGFDPAATAPGRYGLEGIRERVRVFNGKTAIRSAPGKGTLITVLVPLEKPRSVRGKRATRKKRALPRRKKG